MLTGEIVMLRDIKSMNQNIFLTVDTTCPLPRGGDRPPTPKGQRHFEPPPTIPEDNSNRDGQTFWLTLNNLVHDIRLEY